MFGFDVMAHDEQTSHSTNPKANDRSKVHSIPRSCNHNGRIMPILITVVFEKVGEALHFFERIMTTDALNFEGGGVQIQIGSEEKEDMDEFHEAMTKTVVADMLDKVDDFLGEQDNGSE